MNNFICDIPSVFGELWWIYPIILASVIVLCCLAIVFLRKRSDYSEACRLKNRAIKKLEAAASVTLKKKNSYILSAQSMLKSSSYYYETCVNKLGMYHLSDEYTAVASAFETLKAPIHEKDANLRTEKLESLRALTLEKLSAVNEPCE